MKHIFIINPHAGSKDSTDVVRQAIQSLSTAIDHELHTTQSRREAIDYVRQRCGEGSPIRFYACGGDGTLNAVATGMAGFSNAQLTAYPCGSGNDYIKYFGPDKDFSDIQRLVDGDIHHVDLMQVNDSYSINVCNFGFDALVCKTMDHVRRWPLLGGRNAYTTGIMRHLFTGRSTQVEVRLDGTGFFSGRMLLCTMANGTHVGGKYRCAPFSDNGDGLMEVNLFRPMPIVRFAQLIGSYADGSYATREDIGRIHLYRRAATAEISSRRPLYLCVDGEILCDTHFQIRNIPNAIQFVVPSDNHLTTSTTPL